MTEEIGIVKSIDGILAKVNVPKKSACEGCAVGICRPDDKFMEIEAFNQAHAEVGEKVRVTIKTYTYLKGSMLVYGIPALSLVIGAVIGKEVLSSFYAGVDSDILSAISGFSALIVSVIIIRIWTNRAGKKSEPKPVIEEVLRQQE